MRGKWCCGPGSYERLPWGSVAQALNEPLVVVDLDESTDPSSQVIGVLEELGPQALLLDGPHEPFGCLGVLRRRQRRLRRPGR